MVKESGRILPAIALNENINDKKGQEIFISCPPFNFALNCHLMFGSKVLSIYGITGTVCTLVTGRGRRPYSATTM